MTTDSPRVAKLRKLVDGAGGPSAFAKRYSRKDADKPIDETYVSQILNGHRSFGEKAARNMEMRAGLSDGYFNSPENTEQGPDILGRCPLISWVQAGEWTEIIDTFPPGDADEWIPCPVKHGERAFVLVVRGESMFNPYGRPSFMDGDLIFVDPDRQADHGSLVVVRLDDAKEATFKKLVIEGDKKYLRAINPAWPEPMIRINGNATVCGVVIFKGERL